MTRDFELQWSWMPLKDIELQSEVLQRGREVWGSSLAWPGVVTLAWPGVVTLDTDLSPCALVSSLSDRPFRSRWLGGACCGPVNPLLFFLAEEEINGPSKPPSL